MQKLLEKEKAARDDVKMILVVWQMLLMMWDNRDSLNACLLVDKVRGVGPKQGKGGRRAAYQIVEGILPTKDNANFTEIFVKYSLLLTYYKQEVYHSNGFS